MFGHAEKTKPLSDFIEVSFPGEWGQEDKDGNGVKVIRTTNFTNTGKLNLADVVTRDIDSNKVEKKKLKKGDIILERSGGTNDNPVGRVVYFNEDGLYLFNNFTQLLRCKEEVNSLFIFYSLFNYYQMNKRIIRSMGNKTTGIQNLKMDQYWQIPIADVSLELQERFVSIYHQADKSEFDGLKSQFIEMFTNNNFEMVPLGDLCDKISDGSHNPPKGIENSKYLMISSKNVFKDHLDLTDVRYLTEEDFEVENKRTNVKANDVLLTIVGTIGRTYLVKGDEGNLVMQRSVAVLTPNSRVTPLFLMFYLHSDKNLEKEGRGNAQKGIYLKQLSQYEIKVPSIDLQKQFKAIYRQADKVRISNFANR